jgi:hypothetical protein
VKDERLTEIRTAGPLIPEIATEKFEGRTPSGMHEIPTKISKLINYGWNEEGDHCCVVL